MYTVKPYKNIYEKVIIGNIYCSNIYLAMNIRIIAYFTIKNREIFNYSLE